MARPLRPHAPGQGIHITARVQNGAALFTPNIQHSIAWLICEAAAFCGTAVLALVVMPNHFHLVVKQGSQPLGWMMQRAMQQTARLIRNVHGGEGHVFGRRYWSCVCPNSFYLRQAIIYTHLNPWKAGLCDEPANYACTTQPLATLTPMNQRWASLVSWQEARLLFAADSIDDDSITRNYLAYIEYWKFRYKLAKHGSDELYRDTNDPERPFALMGDAYWAANYVGGPVEVRSAHKHDTCERAIKLLKLLDEECSLDVMRIAGRSAAISGLRRNLIEALLLSGESNGAIARCLFVSPALVSSVAASIRLKRSTLQPNDDAIAKTVVTGS